MSSVTLMHPAKAVGWNEIPFGRDTRVVQSNTVLDSDRGPHGMGKFGGLNLQFAVMVPIAKLLSPLLLF